MACGAPPHTPSGEIISPDPPCFVRCECREAGEGKGNRVRPSTHPPSSASPLPPLPSTLRHHSPHPVPSSLRRMGALARRLRGHVPNGCPSAPSAFPKSPFPRFPPLHHVPRLLALPCFRDPTTAALSVPLFRRPLPPSPPLPSRRLSAVSRPSARIPSRARRPSLPSRAPFATRSPLNPPHALIPAFSGAPHRVRPPLPQFSPSLPLSLPRRYFFSALFTNVEFLIDL